MFAPPSLSLPLRFSEKEGVVVCIILESLFQGMLKISYVG